MNSLWTPNRLNAMWIGAVVALFLAAFFGILYGAWSIFQPFPQLSIGPVSVYLIAAVILCLVAAWEIGKRALMVEKGYGNPAWTAPVALVALAAGCVGIWAASAVATVHTPDASAKNQVHAPVQAQAPAPLTPDQSDNISKKYCAGGDTVSCLSTEQMVANIAVSLYGDHKRTCNTLSRATDQVGTSLYRDCRGTLWGDRQLDEKHQTQMAVSIACDQVDALAMQLPADQQNRPELKCSDAYRAFAASDPTDPFTDPPGF